MKRCLLISPLAFYTFHDTVADALHARAYHVDLINEDYPFNVVGKIIGKVGSKLSALSLLRWLTLRAFSKRLENEDRYDLIIIIRGRGMGRKLLEYLRTKADRIVGYNFDSFQINPSPLDWRDLTDKFATFDIEEAEKYNAPLVHLFSGTMTDLVGLAPEYDLSVIMRLHSSRLAYLEEVLDALPEAKTFVFLYEPGYVTLLFGLLGKPRLYFKFRSLISLTPMSYREALTQMAKSRVTLDFAHPMQSGMTLRCFEARSLGVRILSSNPYILDCDLFDAGGVGLHALGGDKAVLQATFAQLLDAPTIAQQRDTQDFLDDLLEEIRAEPATAPTAENI
jgi:hypothetical protein